MENIKEHDGMVEIAKEFNEKHLLPIAKKLDDENRPPVELLGVMKELGFFGMHFPKEYGGGGLPSIVAYEVATEIAKASAGVALMLHVHWMAIDTIIKFGSEEQKQMWLPDLVSGKKISAYVISETQAGSDAGSITTQAVKDGANYILNGSKYFCTNGEIADLYVIAAKTDMEAKAKGISVFVIEKGRVGMTISKPIEKMGCRSSITTAVLLKDCVVSEKSMLGRENGGFKIAMFGLISGRLGMASMGLGIAEACLEESATYANKRVAFDKPISSLYSIQEMIADMYIKIEGVKYMMRAVADKRDSGVDYALDTSVIKVFTAEVVDEVCHKALQVFGGHGYVKGNAVERYARDGRLMDIGVGATEVLKMVVGSTILRNYR